MLSRYIELNTIIHKLSGVSKILSILLMLITLLFTNNFLILTIIWLLTFIIIVLTKLPFKNYLKSILSLKFFLIIMIIINLLVKTPFFNLVLLLSSLIIMVLYSSILISTTKTDGIITSFSYLLIPFKRLLNINKISFMLGMSLSLVPIILEQSNKIKQASVVRNLDYNTKNIIKKVKTIKLNIIPIFLLSLKRADDIAQMLELKGFDYNKIKTGKIKLQMTDYVFLIIHLLLLLLTIWGNLL